jgi:hypothetical protein
MKGKIRITGKAILQGFLHMGYSVMTAINELIDNSVDAGSTLIEIFYNSKKNTLIIKDNGCGMSFERLRNAINIGFERMYADYEIGNFGVGLNTGSLNLFNTDNRKTSLQIVTSDGIEKTVLLWDPLIGDTFGYSINHLTPDNSKGTTITINEVKKLNSSSIQKHLRVVFYPTLKNGKVKIFVDGSEVIGLDPLYRDSELTESTNVIANVNGHSIDIFATSINKDQPKHSWDRESKDGGWASSNGGIYAIYGSRYIEYGGTYPTPYKNPWDSRTRMEFTIPKILTNEFDVHLNKTQSINFHKNENIEDVLRKLKDMLNWGQKVRGRFATKTKKEENIIENISDAENIQDLIDILNDATINPHLKNAIVGYHGKNRKLNLNLKAEECLADLSGNNSQGYGARIAKFIIKNTSLQLSPPNNNEGDAILYSVSTKFSLLKNLYTSQILRKLLEIKVSFCDLETNSTFAILRIKPTQKLDYYILCLIDLVIPEGATKPIDYIGYFYVISAAYIEQSDDFKRTSVIGTKEANKGNVNVELRFTIKKEEAFEKFGKHNMARGTSFFDIRDCINSLNNAKEDEKVYTTPNMAALVNPNEKMNQKHIYSQSKVTTNKKIKYVRKSKSSTR